ncbi:MAG: ATP-dependent DNA helicase RecG [Pseudomonadota bacterium]
MHFLLLLFNSYFMDIQLRHIKNVGPKTLESFSSKEIYTVEDLLCNFPRKYQDRRYITNISFLKDNEEYVVKGKIAKLYFSYLKSKKRSFDILIEDGTGRLHIRFFNYNYKHVSSLYRKGQIVILFGKVNYFKNEKTMIHPEVEILGKHHKDELKTSGRILPIYSEIEGIYQKNLRKIVSYAMEAIAEQLSSKLPEPLSNDCEKVTLKEALKRIHYPKIDDNLADLNQGSSKYHKRFIYDEIFYYLLALKILKAKIKNEIALQIKWDPGLQKSILGKLDFTLTKSQLEALKDISVDFDKKHPMSRILVGDVGCGKTLVAMIAAIQAVKSNTQACIVCPTKILAKQHYNYFKKITQSLFVNIRLLTSDLLTDEKEITLNELKNGDCHIVIGTHSLIQDQVDFKNLGFVVIDEQQRFGLNQRSHFFTKGFKPHTLTMTATPIPRSCALLLFGELDITIMTDHPRLETKIDTSVIAENQFASIKEKLIKRIENGSKIFIVCPYIESEAKINVNQTYKKVTEEYFPGIPSSMIHGKIESSKKDERLAAFNSGKIKILVSTTIIEVGIDIQEADTMLIFDACAFGLSQLHQLRGRIGRMGQESLCYLVYTEKDEVHSVNRLNRFSELNDGFEIAKLDMDLRGKGEFLGIRQSGRSELKFIEHINDTILVEKVIATVENIISKDKELQNKKNTEYKAEAINRWGLKMEIGKMV